MRQLVPSSALDALPHLRRRLVGEGDGEHAVGGRDALSDQIRDAMRDDARLARPRAREDQQWSCRVLNGGLLFGIEGGEEIHFASDQWSVVSGRCRLRSLATGHWPLTILP